MDKDDSQVPLIKWRSVAFEFNLPFESPEQLKSLHARISNAALAIAHAPESDVTFVVSLPRESVWQLAQFVKRLTFSQARENARNDDEAYMMLGALNAIRRELADYHGIAPR